MAAGVRGLDGLDTHMHDVERQLAALARQLPDVTAADAPRRGRPDRYGAGRARGRYPGRFLSGSHFRSFLGLTPKEDSSGGRRRLGAISKQGDVYVRTLLTHGARSLVWHAKAAGQPTALVPSLQADVRPSIRTECHRLCGAPLKIRRFGVGPADPGCSAAKRSRAG